MAHVFKKFGIATLSLAVLGLTHPAAGKPFTPAQSGQEVAREGNSRGATACVACHGADGAGVAETGYPRLAGLPKPYLIAQLQAFRAGTRHNELMQRIAQALDDEEMEMVSAYYADMKVPDTHRPLTDDARKKLGAQLLYVGKWDQGVPACVRCHGQDAQGVPPVFPRLAGQYASYLEDQLHHWRDGERTNDPLGLMEAVAQGLNDEEIRAVAAYLASLSPAPPRAAGAERETRANASVEEHEGTIERITEWLSSSEPGVRPPGEERIPHDEFGKMVLHGKRVFTQTQVYAKEYIGNGMNCVNCHLDRGRRTESASMGMAYVRYPRYRSKNQKVNTIVDRIQGCFRYSENGTPPPPASDTMKGLVSYFYFLSTGLPSATDPKQSGYPKLDKPPEEPSRFRGAKVFATHCAMCHGANGEGTRLGAHYQFPPLWGPDSFNWGAGMHRVNTAAAFIGANMPLGRPGHLSLQETWDVAAFINSQERPQDPRYDGNLAATREQYHDHQCFYGQAVGDRKMGKHAPE